MPNKKAKREKKKSNCYFPRPDELLTRLEMPNNTIYYLITLSLKFRLWCYSGGKRLDST